MMIMWGVLVFVANMATWLWPPAANYYWLAVYVLGIAGSFAISAANQASTGVRSFDIRVLLAFLMFVAFGFLCAHVLGHFTPRQQGTFWTIYFMLFSCTGRSVVRLCLRRHRARDHRTDAGRVFLRHRRRLPALDGLRQRRRPDRRRPLDAADLMAELDDIIHQPLRLKIMAALNSLPATAAGLEFSRLKKLTGATDGNLGAHIETLAKAGYVSVDKAFVGKKPQTTVTATATGRGAFARHVATLQEIIAGKQV